MATKPPTDMVGARDAVEGAANAAWQRMDGARHDLSDRAVAASGQLRDRLEDVDLEPNIRRAKITFWTAIRALVGALVAVPAAAVRGLGSLSTVADEAVDRGSELSNRSREIIRTVPITRRQRRRARNRTVAWSVGGFAVGMVAGAIGGFLLARRDPDLMDEAREAARTTASRARASAEQASQRAKEIAEGAMGSGQDAKDAATDEVMATASDAVERAEDATVSAIEQAQGAAVDATEQAQGAAVDATEQAKDATRTAAERAQDAADRVSADQADEGRTAPAERGRHT